MNIKDLVNKKIMIVIVINLIIGSLLLIGFDKSDVPLKERLEILLAFSLAAIVSLILLMKLVKPHRSVYLNGFFGIIATLIVPLLGTILYDLDIALGGFSGMLGIILYPQYWAPMAIVNFILFAWYGKA